MNELTRDEARHVAIGLGTELADSSNPVAKAITALAFAVLSLPGADVPDAPAQSPLEEQIQSAARNAARAAGLPVSTGGADQPIRGEIVDLRDKPVGEVRWGCVADGCDARRHEFPAYQMHEHLLTSCGDGTCPLEYRHAHLTRKNINRYVGAPCPNPDCEHAQWEHAHWFNVGDPETPTDVVWMVRR